MKGGIAAFLCAIDNIDLSLIKRGLQIILTYDEETFFEGINVISNSNIGIADNTVLENQLI